MSLRVYFGWLSVEGCLWSWTDRGDETETCKSLLSDLAAILLKTQSTGRFIEVDDRRQIAIGAEGGRLAFLFHLC